MKRIEIYDTTLRDGTQGEGVAFSPQEKVKIAQRMDQIGFHYVEGGWPGSNPRDMEFFELARKETFKHTKIAAFGSTRRGNVKVAQDGNIKALLASKAPVMTIFGKSWDLHVKKALRVSLEENLAMIGDSVKYLKSKREQCIYDAEHFFDGYKNNPEYALKTLETAWAAGADMLVLCETNGGCVPSEIAEIMDVVQSRLKAKYGIHTHNDSDNATANAITAVQKGAVHVQGTINGIGERIGNSDLCCVIPNLQVKLGYRCLSKKNLTKLTDLSHYVNEAANLVPRNNQPFVGRSAFAHKGGIHVSAVMKLSRTYEHMDPELIGNRRRVLVSDLSGVSNVKYKSEELGFDASEDRTEMRQVVNEIKRRENEGYYYENAEASFELLTRRQLHKLKDYFHLNGFRVITERYSPEEDSFCEATVRIKVDGIDEHTAAYGDGPVNALDMCLRKALKQFYPELDKMHLVDYKVRVLDGREATEARVRVNITSTNGDDTWTTIGVSTNIIEASWEALVDSVSYFLLKNVKVKPKKSAKKPARKKK
jgi:2-isopropylmalate synthase